MIGNLIRLPNRKQSWWSILITSAKKKTKKQKNTDERTKQGHPIYSICKILKYSCRLKYLQLNYLNSMSSSIRYRVDTLSSLRSNYY